MNIVDRVRGTYKEKYVENPVSVSLLTILFVFFAFFIISLVATGGNSFYSILNSNRMDTFSDHFDSIMYSIDRPYTYWGVIYPPLATFFYASLGHFLTPFVDVDAVESLSFALRDSQLGIMSFFIIMFLAFYALHRVFTKLTKNMNVHGEILFLMIVFSYPFIYALERGNSILFVVVFCFIFLMGYKSENKWIRYLSYAALGCAAGFKIYPAIFGLLILRERNYREAAICAVIGAAFVLFPFVFTDGDPIILIKAIVSYAGQTSIGNGFMNLSQLTITLFHLFLPSSTVNIISTIVIVLVTGLSVIVILFDREMKLWKVVAIIACNLILGPGIGTQYLYVYMVIPMLFFLMSENDMTRHNKFFVISFAMTMILVPGFIWPPAVTSLRTVFVLLMLAVLLIEGFARMRTKHSESETPFLHRE